MIRTYSTPLGVLESAEDQLREHGLSLFRNGDANNRMIPFWFGGINFVRHTFIETGTDTGYTTIHALRSGFQRCHTVDIRPGIVKQARALFAGLPQITAHCGDSREVLPGIINPDEDTTFFLDAHSEDDCPLLDELEIIASTNWRTLPLIMIDDGVPLQHSPDTRFPTFTEVTGVLHCYDAYTWRGGRNGGDTILFCIPKELACLLIPSTVSVDSSRRSM